MRLNGTQDKGAATLRKGADFDTLECGPEKHRPLEDCLDIPSASVYEAARHNNRQLISEHTPLV